MSTFPYYYGCINGIDNNYCYNIDEEFENIKNEDWFIEKINSELELIEIDVEDSDDDSDTDSQLMSSLNESDIENLSTLLKLSEQDSNQDENIDQNNDNNEPKIEELESDDSNNSASDLELEEEDSDNNKINKVPDFIKNLEFMSDDDLLDDLLDDELNDNNTDTDSDDNRDTDSYDNSDNDTTDNNTNDINDTNDTIDETIDDKLLNKSYGINHSSFREQIQELDLDEEFDNMSLSDFNNNRKVDSLNLTMYQ